MIRSSIASAVRRTDLGDRFRRDCADGWSVVRGCAAEASANCRGWKPAAMLIGPIVNGVWGLGTALFYRFSKAR